MNTFGTYVIPPVVDRQQRDRTSVMHLLCRPLKHRYLACLSFEFVRVLAAMSSFRRRVTRTWLRWIRATTFLSLVLPTWVPTSNAFCSSMAIQEPELVADAASWF